MVLARTLKELFVHLLFADDQYEIRRLVKLTLQQWWSDVTVTTAENGEMAVELVASGQEFDLILLDHHMPPGALGGSWTAQQIKRLQPAVPVVFLSAYTTEKDIFSAKVAGAEGYISKEMIVRREVFTAIVGRDWERFAKLADGKSVWYFKKNGFPAGGHPVPNTGRNGYA